MRAKEDEMGDTNEAVCLCDEIDPDDRPCLVCEANGEANIDVVKQADIVLAYSPKARAAVEWDTIVESLRDEVVRLRALLSVATMK
jgi:hypothetical protein